MSIKTKRIHLCMGGITWERSLGTFKCTHTIADYINESTPYQRLSFRNENVLHVIYNKLYTELPYHCLVLMFLINIDLFPTPVKLYNK